MYANFSSKRGKMIGDTINTLMNMLSANTMAQNFGLTVDQVDQICTAAIKITAKVHNVTESTVYSKCVREIGFSTKVDFVGAVINQMAHIDNTLYYALVYHLPAADSSWDVERFLGLPFASMY